MVGKCGIIPSLDAVINMSAISQFTRRRSPVGILDGSQVPVLHASRLLRLCCLGESSAGSRELVKSDGRYTRRDRRDTSESNLRQVSLERRLGVGEARQGVEGRGGDSGDGRRGERRR